MSTRAAAAAERITAQCGAALEVKTLRERVLTEIGAVVAFDAHVWALTDPVTRVVTSPHADLPFLPWAGLPELIRWRHLTTVNRWDLLAVSGVTTALLGEATEGDLARSVMWREVFSAYGVVDIATVVFADRFGCWGFLDLLRCAPRTRFDAEDRDFLATIEPDVTGGLRSAQARTFVDVGEPAVADGPAVVLLASDLGVRHQTSAAAAALLQLNPPGFDMAPIPAAVYNVAGALVAQENGMPLGPPRSRVHIGAGRWVTLHADRIGEGDIAVTIESSTPADRLEVFGLAHGLTPREREVVAALVAGNDNRTIARTMVLSEHTVHDHVKAVLAKCGTTSRQLLISRVAGTR